MASLIRRLLLVLVLVPGLRGEVPPLLQEVVDKLTDERQRWAFTQFVREFDGDRVTVERVERFDPTRGWERRWRLLRLNGRAPTAEEVEAWSKKKNRARKRPPKELAEYEDLAQARVSHETAERVSYEIPFRRSAGGLFPGEKVDLTLTINKRTRALERALVGIDESFSVALGLARIIDLAHDAVAKGVATKEDIDTAMRLGVNYPLGPFEWSRRLGRNWAYALLDDLHLRDPSGRYAPSLALYRHAYASDKREGTSS